jgi:hypothetical protein
VADTFCNENEKFKKISMKQIILSGNMQKQNGISRQIEERRNRIVEIIASLLILLFVYTAISKIFDFRAFVAVLSTSTVFGNHARLLAYTIPSLELIISLGLFLPKTRRIGLYASTVLLTIFTIYIVYMVIYVPHLPCSCGGVISKMTWTQHIFFNSFFIILGIWGIRLIRKANNESYI